MSKVSWFFGGKANKEEIASKTVLLFSLFSKKFFADYPPMLHARCEHSSVVAGHTLGVFGGYRDLDFTADSSESYASIELLDLSCNPR